MFVDNKSDTWAGLNPLLTSSDGMSWYKNSYDLVLAVSPNKPMMLVEVASIEAGDGGAKKAAWIKQLVTEGITSGCGNGEHCPLVPVSRAQMAVFLVKTFNLP